MEMPSSPELCLELDQIARALAAEFDDIFSRETITRYPEESAELLTLGATVQRLIPSLIERFTRERLRARARAGDLTGNVPDPAGRPVAEVRPIHDEIERRGRALLDSIGTVAR